METPVLALIGGTSLYELPGLEVIERREVETPYGATSAPVLLGLMAGRSVAFMARHGVGHAIAPHRVNYRANLWALHALGVQRVIALNTVGGISARMVAGALVLPDQIVDYTHGREHTYWDTDGEGTMRHVEFGQPYCSELRGQILRAARKQGLALVEPATYGATQGPRFESAAEIVRMNRDGCDIVGMTGMPEAGLARELGLALACLAPVANWAAGCDADGVGRNVPPISLDQIFANLKQATAPLPALLAAVVGED